MLWHELGDWEEIIGQLLKEPVWGDRPFLAPALAQFMKVITYDRAGIADSTPPEQARDLEDFISELTAVLTTVGVQGPAVLIGHSLGGLIAFEYACRFPERVSALILLDSAHPDQIPRFLERATHEQIVNEEEERTLMLEQHPERPDLKQLLSQGAQAVRPHILGKLPLLVVSRGQIAWTPEQAERAPVPMSAGYWEHREATWQALQGELAAASDSSVHLHLPGSGHYVHLDAPQQVLGAIVSLLT